MTYETEQMVDKPAVAKYIQQTTRSVENWMSKGLPHYKLGPRRTRFKLSEVDAFFKEKCRVN